MLVGFQAPIARQPIKPEWSLFLQTTFPGGAIGSATAFLCAIHNPVAPLTSKQRYARTIIERGVEPPTEDDSDFKIYEAEKKAMDDEKKVPFSSIATNY